MLLSGHDGGSYPRRAGGGTTGAGGGVFLGVGVFVWVPGESRLTGAGGGGAAGGSFDMSSPSKEEEAAAKKDRLKEIARKAAHKAPVESASTIVALGQERLKALQAGGVALDTRTTQVAAFQLAAAAFSAGLTASERVGLWGASIAALACVAFVVGSGLAFWGMRCCDNQVAGVEPSFWSGVLSTPRFTDKLARSWAAEITEDFIFEARRVDEIRGDWLNRSLVVGAVGAGLVVLAVGANLGQRWLGSDEKALPAQATIPRQSATSIIPAQTTPRKVSPVQAGAQPQAAPPMLPTRTGPECDAL